MKIAYQITQDDLDRHKSWAQCAACGRTFGADGLFDRHRRDYACVDPSTIGMKSYNGVWRTGPPKGFQKGHSRSCRHEMSPVGAEGGPP